MKTKFRKTFESITEMLSPRRAEDPSNANSCHSIVLELL